MEGSQYGSSVPDNPQLDNSVLVSARLKAQRESAKTEGRVDFTAERFVNWGSSQFSVQELFGTYKFRGENESFTLGRKLEFWSQLDQDWQLGMWQPEAVFDQLRPVDQGLTGFFYKHRSGMFESLAFVSPMFVPTMGPDVKEENGSLVADSRWYKAPAKTFLFSDQEREIVYSLNIPEAWELAQKPGAGYRLSYGGDRPGVWVSANIGYKPMNSLVIKYKRTLNSSEEGVDTGTARVYPDVAYHSLWGADLGYRISQSTMFAISYLEDRPQTIKQDPEDPFIIQHAQPMKAYSVHAETRSQVPGFIEPVGFGLSYLRINGAGIEDFDSDGTSRGAIFSQRFNFTHAAGIKTEISSQVFKKKLISRIKYLRELDQKGMIGSGELHLYPTSNFVLTMGADILGVDDTRDDNRDDRFLNQFRANDRLYGGMSYVF